MEQLFIGKHLLQRMLEHCMDERPNEACGILTGRAGRVLHAYATASSKRSPVFFEVDTEHQHHVLEETERFQDELLAIYHSHPTAPAVPSLNDIQQAVHWPEAIRMIISLSGRTEVRAYRISHGQVREVQVLQLADQTGEWVDLRGLPGRSEVT